MKQKILSLIASICLFGSFSHPGGAAVPNQSENNDTEKDSLPSGQSHSLKDVSVFHGSWHEIGKKYGRIVKAGFGNFQKELEGAISFYKQRGDLSDGQVAAITENAKKDYETYLPWYTEYLRGLAEGSECDEKLIMNWGLANYRLFKVGSSTIKKDPECIPNSWISKCSCVLAGRNATKDSNAILGHNNEGAAWFYDSPGRFVVLLPDKGHAFALYCKFHDPGALGVVAMNEAGLATALVGMKGIKCMGSGIIYIHLKVANECSTVEEAIEVIRKTPMCIAFKVQLADKDGNIAIVYRGSDLCSVVRAGEEEFLYSTRKATAKGFKDLLSLSPATESFLDRRYRFAMEILKKNRGRIDEEVVANILTAKKGDVRYGVKARASIWIERKDSKFGIVVSSILVPRKLKYFYTDTDPFPGKYREVDLKPIFKAKEAGEMFARAAWPGY